MNGIQHHTDDSTEIVHLNLLGRTGREVASAYGIKIVPATLLFDSGGNVLYRHNGFPEEERIRQVMAG